MMPRAVRNQQVHDGTMLFVVATIPTGGPADHLQLVVVPLPHDITPRLNQPPHDVHVPRRRGPVHRIRIVTFLSIVHVQAALQQCYPITAQHSIIVVNHDAGGMLPIRTWPRDRFIALIRRLLANDPRRLVVLMGIAEAAESARDITAQVDDPRCIDFVGRTRTLTDVLQLFHQSDLLITNDSGPAHFATLTRIKSITLFGPETPVLYGTLGEHNVDLFAKLACSPCLSAMNHRHSPCVDNKCLQAISVDQVLAEAERLLAIASTRVTLPAAVEA